MSYHLAAKLNMLGVIQLCPGRFCENVCSHFVIVPAILDDHVCYCLMHCENLYSPNLYGKSAVEHPRAQKPKSMGATLSSYHFAQQHLTHADLGC